VLPYFKKFERYDGIFKNGTIQPKVKSVELNLKNFKLCRFDPPWSARTDTYNISFSPKIITRMVGSRSRNGVSSERYECQTNFM